uniref:Uncharacterized protein n=1 Tax=Anguilla anguilla TaxID=7936 RepID=A0A0E9TN19_ANGAN
MSSHSIFSPIFFHPFLAFSRLVNTHYHPCPPLLISVRIHF